MSKAFQDMVQVGDFAWRGVLEHLSGRDPFQLQVFWDAVNLPEKKGKHNSTSS